jgi:hypothetical protein
MRTLPPFTVKRERLYWLYYMVDQHGDVSALAELRMQAGLWSEGEM